MEKVAVVRYSKEAVAVMQWQWAGKMGIDSK